MDTLLEDGDFAVDSRGMPRQAEGLEELLQRSKIRLIVPKGAFDYDPELGSRLNTLELSGSGLDARALELAQEALAALPAVQAESNHVTVTPEGATVLVRLQTAAGSGEAEIMLKGGEADGNV